MTGEQGQHRLKELGFVQRWWEFGRENAEVVSRVSLSSAEEGNETLQRVGQCEC